MWRDALASDVRLPGGLDRWPSLLARVSATVTLMPGIFRLWRQSSLPLKFNADAPITSTSAPVTNASRPTQPYVASPSGLAAGPGFCRASPGFMAGLNARLGHVNCWRKTRAWPCASRSPAGSGRLVDIDRRKAGLPRRGGLDEISTTGGDKQTQRFTCRRLLRSQIAGAFRARRSASAASMTIGRLRATRQGRGSLPLQRHSTPGHLDMTPHSLAATSAYPRTTTQLRAWLRRRP